MALSSSEVTNGPFAPHMEHATWAVDAPSFAARTRARIRRSPQLAHGMSLVKRRCTRLRQRRPAGTSTNGRSWTNDEDETLRINWPMFPAFLIAHVLGRVRASIYRRAA